ncbi:MAG TPA: PAS domain S-box protein [Geminicoccaceae bacterium]|nr:PAS domain S-box protein [Geminicoccaceae bacterium]
MRAVLEDLPLRPTVGAALILGLALPALLVAWLQMGERRQTLFDNLARDHATIVETLANGMQTPIWDVRPDTAQPLIDVIMGDNRVTAVSVTAPVFPEPLSAAKAGAHADDTVALEQPVLRDGRRIGTVRVEMATAPLRAEAARQGWQAMLIALFQMAFGLLLIFPLMRLKVLAPVARLVGQSQELAAGRLDQPFSWRRKDELGALGRSFEHTRRSLQSLFRDLEQRNSELRLREADLGRQTRVLRATLDNMTDGISLVDREHRLVAWNDRFVEIFGLPPEAVQVGRPIMEVHRLWVQRGGFSDAEAADVSERMREGFDPGRPFTLQIEKPDGAVVLLRRQPMRDEGYVTTYTDVTEQVRARREADETLHLLDTVMDAAPAIVHVKDRELRYRFVNRYFLDLFGLRREDVLGRTRSEVLAPDHVPPADEEGGRVLATGRPSQLYELPILLPGRERIDMLGSKVPLLDADGRATHVVTFEIDITERKRIQQALSDSEQLHRLLVDLSPYGILLHDDVAIRFINPGGCRILGTSAPEAIVGRHYVDFVGEADRAGAQARLEKMLRGEAMAQAERPLVTLDGRRIVVASSGVPVRRGEQRLALVIFADITEMRRAEEEIARQREALHQAEKISALGSLLAGVAHELNNPLSIVVGRSVMLADAGLDPKVAAAVASIRTAAERCAKIVRTFLAMARKQAPTRVPVRVDRVVAAALDLLSYGLESAGIRVTTEVPADLPQTMADPDQLTQVFSNLITNAQQAMIGWSGERRLAIAAEHDQRHGQLRIAVRDTGPGIPEEVRSRIFDPFFTTRSSGGGTGIGLAVCRGVVEAHDGTITADVAPGGGAAFVVTLPIVGPVGAASRPAAPAGRAGRSGRVLVVDDEADIRHMLAEILAADGHVVEQAANGRQALERLRDGPFDLVISDLLMPQLDGPGLYEELCRRDPQMARHLLFITGDTLSSSAQVFLERVGRPAIEKPFVPDEVRRAVRAALAGDDGCGAPPPDLTS